MGARFSTDPLPEHWDEWLLERARTWASQHAAKVSSEDVRHDRYASLLLDALNSLERSSSRVFFSGMLVSAILGSPKPNGVYQWTSVSEEGVYLRALDSALRVIVEEADKSPVGTDGRDEQVGVGSMDGTMTIEMLDADDAYADLKYILDRVHTNQRVQLLEKLLKEYSR